MAESYSVPPSGPNPPYSVQESAVTPVKRISWGSIFAGVFVAIAIQVMLTALGMGIGMATLQPSTGDSPDATTFSIAAAIWWTVTGIISLFAGGYVAGFLAGIPRRAESLLHGFITWAFATAAAIILMAGTALGGLLGMAGMGSAALSNPNVTSQFTGQQGQGGGASPMSVQQRMDPMQSVMQQARAYMMGGEGGQSDVFATPRQPGHDTGTTTRPATQPSGRSGQADTGRQSMARFDQTLRRYLQSGDQASEADRDAVVQMIVNRTGLDESRAREVADEWRTTYISQRDEAKQSAEKASNIATTASFWGFLGLLLGAVAAAVGGLVGCPNRLLVAGPTRRV